MSSFERPNHTPMPGRRRHSLTLALILAASYCGAGWAGAQQAVPPSAADAQASSGQALVSLARRANEGSYPAYAKLREICSSSKAVHHNGSKHWLG